VTLSPPAGGQISTLFAAMAETVTRLPRRQAWLIALLMMAVVSLIDKWTGPHINLLPAYLIIVCFASWCLGERAGLAMGGCAVLLMGLINGFGRTYLMEGQELPAVAIVWNTLARLFAVTLLAGLAGGLRWALDDASWRAATDGLTGVLNRPAFSRRLGGLVEQAQRRGDALVIAYVDIDGFKGVNDTYGHAAGDTLLRQFAEATARDIRSGDLFARIGGDEFILLLTVANCQQGDVAAERLHQRMTSNLQATGHDVTCSVGALVLDSRQVSHPDRLTETADGLMYEVKRAGKNALRVARGDLQTSTEPEPFVPIPDRRQPPRIARSAA